jgi:CheY-like chemotaxis protein
MNADRAKSKAAGYRHHLLKPFDPDAIDAILDQAMKDGALSLD